MNASALFRPHILIVDDHEGVRRLLELAVAREGLAATQLSNAEAAFEWLATNPTDLMLLDLSMPGMSGRDLVEKLGQRGRHVPFIVVTGQDDHKTVVDMMKLGAMDFLTKPFVDHELLTSVRRSLERIGQKRQLDIAREEQNRLTLQLEAERHHLRDLLAIVPGIVWEISCAAKRQIAHTRYVSNYLEEMLGYTARECFSNPQFWFSIIHPDDRVKVTADQVAALTGKSPKVSKFRMFAKDGRVVWVACHIVSICNTEGEIMGLRGVITDITTLHWAEVRRDLEITVANAFSRAGTLASAAREILKTVCEALGWTLGELWLVDPEAGALRLAACWNADRSWDEFEAFTTELKLYPGDALPGTVWTSGVPLWISDLGEVEDPRANHALVGAQVRCAFAHPIKLQDNVLGVFALYAAHPCEASHDEVLHTFPLVGAQIGQFIERRRTEEIRLRLEREILEVTEAEQRRIGHDLHDDLCQQLVGVQLISNALHDRLLKVSPLFAETAGAISVHIGKAVDRARKLAHGLSPVEMDKHGLMVALQKLADNSSELFCIDCGFICPQPVALDSAVTAAHLYRITQEAITNAVRHGRASQVVITLTVKSRHGTLQVTDNGHGFPPNACSGMGLRTMRYRANAIGGSLEVRPVDDKGSKVRCRFPLPRASLHPSTHASSV